MSHHCKLLENPTFASALILVAQLLSLSCACFAEALPDNQMAKWTYRAAGDIYKLTTDDTVKFEQKPALSLQTTQAHQDSSKFYAAPFQDVPVDKFRGKRVQYSAFLKTDDVEASSGLWMKAKSRDTVVAFDNMDSRAIKGTRDWKKYSVVLDVPPDADTLSIGFYMAGSGKLWLANPDVETVSKSVKASAKKWDEKKYWQFANELKKQPVNLDFTHSSSDSNLAPSDWLVFTSKSPSKVGVDKNAIYQNKPSGFIEQQEEHLGDFVLFFQDISASNYLGKRVNLSGFLKTKGVTDWTALFMRVDAGKTVLTFDNMEDRPIKGDTDWTHHSVVLDVPPNATRIRFGFMQAGSGKSWLNSSKLAVVDKSVPLTAKPEPVSSNCRAAEPMSK